MKQSSRFAILFPTVARRAATALALLVPGAAFAQEPALNTGDTAWMLTATALVLFMTIPGLALFYGGLVRSKNVLSVLMQCFGITAMVTVLWALYAYSLSFATDNMAAGVRNVNSVIGGLSALFLGHVQPGTLHGTIPESVFVCFQFTFAIITPALICGA